jgi:hypothetical protein
VPAWVGVFIFVVVVATGLIVHWLTSHHWSKRYQTEQTERRDMSNAAARLPDVQERADRAELEVRTLRQDAQQRAAREASLQVQFNERHV